MPVQHTINWVRSIVIDLNLCPFAQREIDSDRVRIQTSPALKVEDGLQDFIDEVTYLNDHPAIGTSLLLFPHFLNDFMEYLDFVDLANALLKQGGYDGVFQIATFHPLYRFHGTDEQDVGNYTNRSPYPMLHLLREEMLDHAIAYYGNTEDIPENNIRCLEQIGLTELLRRLDCCVPL